MLAEIGLSGLLNYQEYSPTRHLASAIFPFSDRHKYMLMLSAYMDETGHSKDQRQRFNGMAGLMGLTRRLARMERKWNKTLGRFRLPYFHMKDFATFRGFYSGWNEQKRQDLYGRLLTHVEGARPFLVGSILAMDDFRGLTPKQQADFVDPYHIGFMSVTTYIAVAADGIQPPDERVALIFSDQVEFRHDALRMYERARQNIPLIEKRTDPPVFRDMKRLVPLQAADVVAYELYKEYERQLDRPNAEPRHGYKMFCKITKNAGIEHPMFAFQTKASLNIGGKATGPRWAGTGS